MNERAQFAFFMARNSSLEWRDVEKLMRLAATHRRIETELTNGYKLRNGNEDAERTKKAIAKRDRIDAQMETICKIEYGALTVRAVLDGREVYIP